MKALTKRKTDYDECDRHRSRKQSLVQPRQESVKETMPPVISVVVHGSSVAYSYSSSLQSYQDSLPIFPSHRPATSTQDESLFLPQGDYWTIGYQRHVVFLKATRGLHDLALLLRNPGREFHVCELVGQVIGRPLVFGKGGRATDAWQDRLLSDAGPMLDARAKAEYKHRLDDLRGDLEEAERFNDPTHAERARDEMDTLAEQLAAAIGLGGRNRRSGSAAERARSAVTKRIKSSIKRIGEAIPLLGSHLASRVKTGYFCSYNPPPERPVAWKF
jgi:hypothetical protein